MITAKELITKTEETSNILGISNKVAEVEKSFKDLLLEYGIDDIEVKAEQDGADWLIEFKNKDGDIEVISFCDDAQEGAFAIVSSQQEETGDDEGSVIDLDTLEPTMLEDGGLDLTDLSWLNKSTLQALFGAEEEESDERFKTAIRAGKKVKIPIKLRKKILNPKQKAALARNRKKAQTSSAKRNRALSVKSRKRLGVR